MVKISVSRSSGARAALTGEPDLLTVPDALRNPHFHSPFLAARRLERKRPCRAVIGVFERHRDRRLDILALLRHCCLLPELRERIARRCGPPSAAEPAGLAAKGGVAEQ